MRATEEIHEISCAVFVALREELRPLASCLRRPRSFRRGSLRYTLGLLEGRRIAICRTGIGKTNAARRCRALLDALTPRSVLVTGFAGGLSPDWTVGDCLIASRVTDVPARTFEEAPERREALTKLRSWEAPEEIVRRTVSSHSGHGVRTAHLISVERVLRTPAEKVAAGDALDAQAVDMESSGILSVTGPAGIPALCARVILDEQDFELPLDFGRIMNAEGEVSAVKTLLSVGTRPHRWPDLAELRKRAISATRVLETFAPRVLKALATPVGSPPRS